MFSFLQSELGHVDFERLTIQDGSFIKLDMSKVVAGNLTITESTMGTMVLPGSVPPNTAITNCIAERIIGVTAPTALPTWINGLEADRFDSVASVSRIRQIGLEPPQEILITIIRKTFFQKGAGRKEEALLRGLGQLAAKNTAQEIVNMLLKSELLGRFKGDEGWVYTPNRNHAGRMKQMLYELETSQDPLWTAVSQMK